MHKYILGLTMFVCCIIMTSCAQKKKDDNEINYMNSLKPNHDYVVTIKTKYGDMVAILYDDTPKHKENFIKLAKEHYYDSLLFHRIIKGFMIQGGDPNSKNAKPGQQLGNGGPEYTIPAEFNPKYYHVKGALSAARMGDQVNPTKASSGSQFYIVHGTTFAEEDLKIDQQKMFMALRKFLEKPENEALSDSLNALYQTGDMDAYQKKITSLCDQVEEATGMTVKRDIPAAQLDAYTTIGGAPHLDGQYTVFGRVIEGLDVIDQIATLPTGAADRPEEDIMMMVEVKDMPKKKIEKQYGYTYPD